MPVAAHKAEQSKIPEDCMRLSHLSSLLGGVPTARTLSLLCTRGMHVASRKCHLLYWTDRSLVENTTVTNLTEWRYFLLEVEEMWQLIAGSQRDLLAARKKYRSYNPLEF